MIRTLNHADLPALASAIRDLIADGVYGLYEVHHQRAAYMVTIPGGERYYLDSDGAIIGPGSALIRCACIMSPRPDAIAIRFDNKRRGP